MPTIASAIRYAPTVAHGIRIRTRNGRIHSVYWGEKTLWHNRNPHSIAPLTATHG